MVSIEVLIKKYDTEDAFISVKDWYFTILVEKGEWLRNR